MLQSGSDNLRNTNVTVYPRSAADQRWLSASCLPGTWASATPSWHTCWFCQGVSREVKAPHYNFLLPHLNCKTILHISAWLGELCLETQHQNHQIQLVLADNLNSVYFTYVSWVKSNITKWHDINGVYCSKFNNVSATSAHALGAFCAASLRRHWGSNLTNAVSGSICSLCCLHQQQSDCINSHLKEGTEFNAYANPTTPFNLHNFLG